ncbi:hypothetical protein [Pseudonocardia sp. HH130630-07]|uniref:hypothetical protein n=1 Tax=Pseudonocardia sp. HH130630-07 TaxID=1690815 RepID=UPI000814F301|nr:hypothetical protein [Pseudonocardia sp. HH130630-07]ANY05480.1 hypothetical protein AFB00_03230 [Pseudonocardia sp. HH130630-07]
MVRPDGAPAAGPGRQADRFSCGPAVLLVTAAMLTARGTAPGAGPTATTGPDGSARSAGRAPHGASPPAGSAGTADAQRAAHRQANLIWPRLLGTTPWGMRAWLRRTAPGRYRIRPATPAALRRAAATGLPVPVLVGSALLPRHWVLLLGTAADGRWRVYEPGAGTVRTCAPGLRAPGVARELGWPRPWGVLLPV